MPSGVGPGDFRGTWLALLALVVHGGRPLPGRSRAHESNDRGHRSALPRWRGAQTDRPRAADQPQYGATLRADARGAAPATRRETFRAGGLRRAPRRRVSPSRRKRHGRLARARGGPRNSRQRAHGAEGDGTASRRAIWRSPFRFELASRMVRRRRARAALLWPSRLVRPRADESRKIAIALVVSQPGDRPQRTQGCRARSIASVRGVGELRVDRRAGPDAFRRELTEWDPRLRSRYGRQSGPLKANSIRSKVVGPLGALASLKLTLIVGSGKLIMCFVGAASIGKSFSIVP